MDNKKLLDADYLDIIFDERNKKYGGYELRKHYNQRASRALLTLFLGLGGIVCFSFIGVSHEKEVLIERKVPTVLTKVDKTPVEPPKTLPKVVTPPPVAKVKMQIFTEPEITKAPIDPDKQMTENKKLGAAQPGLSNVTSDSIGIASVQPKVPGTGVIGDPEATKPSQPVNFVAQMPVFIGDMNAYINGHLQYPTLARENRIEGKVIIRFVVNEDGAVSDAIVARGIGGGCDEEAMRMVRGMPKWKPGKQNGLPMKVYFSLPINFELRD